VRRREIALVVVLAAAVAGGAVGLLIFVGPDRGGWPAAAPHAVEARDREEVGADACDRPAPIDAGASSPHADAAPPTEAGALREVEGSEEVTFAGLIELVGAAAGAEPLDGTIVLVNADSSAPPLRIELPVGGWRFRGAGPGNSVVAVERLVLGGREVATREEEFRLGTRWLRVGATLAAPIVLHVVDAASGGELSGVTLRDSVHSEKFPVVAGEFDANGVRSGSFCVVKSRRSRSPPASFDSPLQIASFRGRTDSPSRLSMGRSSTGQVPDVVLVHVPGYGDELGVIAEEEREVTLRLRPAASLQVTVAPWPPAGAAADATRAMRFVGVAREIELPAEKATVREDATTPRLMEGFEPRLEALARESLARRRLRTLAAESPQRHRAQVDERGVATFDDLCEGRWIAWLGAPGETLTSRFIVIDRPGLHEGGDAPIEPVVCALDPGKRNELELRSDSPAADGTTLTLRCIDAESGERVPLKLQEIAVDDLDDPGSRTRPTELLVARASVRRTVAGNPYLEAPSNDTFAVRPGIAVVTIRPSLHPEFEPVTRWVEIHEGKNDVAIPLAHPTTVLVTVEDDGMPFATNPAAASDVGRVRLTRDGAEFVPTLDTPPRGVESPRHVFRFSPLEPGRYELLVPDDAGFDRPGKMTLEVQTHHVTKVELHRHRSEEKAPERDR
jgi:hypothetical protein